MTDIAETETQPTTEPTGPMKYAPKDTLTIMRGIHRGKSATVIDVDTVNRQYAVKLPDGAFLVINEVNTKEPTAGQVSVTRLAAIVKDWYANVADDSAESDNLIQDLRQIEGFSAAFDA